MIGYFAKRDFKELISAWRKAMVDYKGFDREIIFLNDEELMKIFTPIKFIRDIDKKLREILK